MWSAIAEGPIASYINPKFGTMYNGDIGGFEAFMTQCAYVPKLYVPSGGLSYAEYQFSAKSVECDIYGISIPVYSFMDCGTQRNGGDVAWNGYGIDNDGSSGSGTGNFNQFVYVPNSPNSYAT